MILLPLFWDQHDNAQRMHEAGFGVRLSTYEHSPEELLGAIERLRGDAALKRRLEDCSRRLRSFGGAARAASLIEQVAGAPAA